MKSSICAAERGGDMGARPWLVARDGATGGGRGPSARIFGIRFGVIVAAVPLLLAGCLSVPIPQAEADPARFYVLSTVSAGASSTSAPGEKAAPAVHLLPVEISNYLRSRTMIVRRGENEIQFREFARWGESLDLGIGRVLREELLARGIAGNVHSGSVRPPGVNYDFSVLVRVLACEGGADGSVLFRAAWELAPVGATDGKMIRGEYRPTDLRWDGKSEGSLAAQLSVAVSGLAGEIGAAMQKGRGGAE